MDILRKELNAIYEAQRLGEETLYPADVKTAARQAETIADATGGCTVVTDASCDRCYIFAGPLGALMGLTGEPRLYREVESSDEDEIYGRIHPEDLVEKRMLEYEFFKAVDALPTGEKLCYRATCRLRMRDRDGSWRTIDNSTQVAALSPKGRMWLILCCYALSPEQDGAGGISPRIVNTATGEITALELGERRKSVLSEREKQVLRLVQEGKASKNIADILGISIHTVNRHRQNIMEKLSVGNCVEAIAAATAMRLL